MYGYIYITTNTINGKKYIGRHKSNIFDDSYKGSGSIFLKAINKYGEENFKVSILEECSSEEELDEKEEYWINFYDAVNNDEFYNLSKSGYKRGVTGYKHSEESRNQISQSLYEFYGNEELSRKTKQRISEKSKGKNNGFYGKHHTEETRKKMSENWDYSEHFTPEVKKKISDSLKGRHHTEETKRKIGESQKGKIISEEARKKMSIAKKGKKPSLETREKMSKNRKNNPKFKPPNPTGKSGFMMKTKTILFIQKMQIRAGLLEE